MKMREVLAMPSELILVVAMLSDWHIGTGTGRPGVVNRQIRRDCDKLPFLPAKTLTGIWRDACEQVAYALDRGNPNGGWHQWVEVLFGDQPSQAKAARLYAPLSAAVTISSARLPNDLRHLLSNKPALRRALTFVKPGVKICQQSGSAEDQCLRFDEMARKGIGLCAKVGLSLPSEDTADLQQAIALLWAGAQFVERIGGGRRRGAGRCRFDLCSADVETCLRILGQAPRSPSMRATEVPKSLAEEKVTEAWHCFDLFFTLNTPVVIPSCTVGNVVERLDYIPGTYFLPLVTEHCRRLGVDIMPAFLASAAVITHATIEVGGAAGRAFPAALQREKSAADDLGKVANLLNGSPTSQQLKSTRNSYIGPLAERMVSHTQVPLTVTTHNIVSDQEQRPTEGVIGVYSYQAIPAGLKFRAQLRLRTSIAKHLAIANPDWWKQLEGRYRIGRSRKDEYGELHISVAQVSDVAGPAGVAADERLYIWLLSDILLRDECLQPTTSISALRKALSDRLQVPLDDVSLKDGAIQVIGHPHRIESWHTKWCLPRPTLSGLAAGTCLVFSAGGDIPPERLLEVIQSGIGDRCPEGYGQISINDPLLTNSTKEIALIKVVISPLESESATGNTDRINAENREMAELISSAAWREAIRRASIELAAARQNRTASLGIIYPDETTPSQGRRSAKPSQSQLMAFLTALQYIKMPNDEAVQQWLSYIAETKHRKREWEKSSDAIRNLLTKPEWVWKVLGGDESVISLPLYEKVSPEQLVLIPSQIETLQQELWSEAVWTLADACIRAHKRDQESAITALV
jgi:CRISPR-associated protein Csx10